MKTHLRADVSAWIYMRLSAILLVPLVWIHAVINSLIIGGHHINLELVEARWGTWGWRAFDALILAFAFSHGVNGLRQVLFDFTPSTKGRKLLNILLLFFWLALSILGFIGIIGGAGER